MSAPTFTELAEAVGVTPDGAAEGVEQTMLALARYARDNPDAVAMLRKLGLSTTSMQVVLAVGRTA